MGITHFIVPLKSPPIFRPAPLLCDILKAHVHRRVIAVHFQSGQTRADKRARGRGSELNAGAKHTCGRKRDILPAVRDASLWTEKCSFFNHCSGCTVRRSSVSTQTIVNEHRWDPAHLRDAYIPFVPPAMTALLPAKVGAPPRRKSR